jgi:HEAT repeat protein
MFHRPLPRTLEASLRDMRDDKERVRRSAIVDLARHAREQVSEPIQAALLRALGDKDPMVRTEAAYALGDGHVADALPALLMAIDDESPRVRQAAIDSIGAIADPRATSRLVRALKDERADVRFQAIIALSKVSPEHARECVLEAGSDDDPHVRYIAVRVAEELCSGSQGSPGSPIEVDESVEQAAMRWLEDIDERVRVASAILLARSGNLSGERFLLAAIEGRVSGLDPEDETAVLEIIGARKIERAIPALERRAFAWRRRWRPDAGSWMAVVSLARLGHPRACGQILRDLQSWSRDRRTMAVAAAGLARLADATEVIQRMRGNERQADPHAVDEALGQLRASQR